MPTPVPPRKPLVAFEWWPQVFTIKGLFTHAQSVSTQASDGRWIPCRPCGYPSLKNRIRCAWLVFTGRADALIWDDNQ